MTREVMQRALENYMAAFGQALEAHGIPYSQQQQTADKEARTALAQPDHIATTGKPLQPAQELGGWLSDEVVENAGREWWAQTRHTNGPRILAAYASQSIMDEVHSTARIIIQAALNQTTSPPQRQSLTDEEAQQAFAKHNCDISKDLAGILARAIEAKLKEKNT